MYQLTGTETQVLVPEYRLNRVAPKSTATWHRVVGFKRHETGEIYGVLLVGQPFMRRAHVVLAGR